MYSSCSNCLRVVFILLGAPDCATTIQGRRLFEAASNQRNTVIDSCGVRQSGLVEAGWAVHKAANVPGCFKDLGCTGLAIFLYCTNGLRKCSSSRGSISSTVGTSQSELTFLGWRALIL